MMISSKTIKIVFQSIMIAIAVIMGICSFIGLLIQRITFGAVNTQGTRAYMVSYFSHYLSFSCFLAAGLISILIIIFILNPGQINQRINTIVRKRSRQTVLCLFTLILIWGIMALWSFFCEKHPHYQLSIKNMIGYEIANIEISLSPTNLNNQNQIVSNIRKFNIAALVKNEIWQKRIETSLNNGPTVLTVKFDSIKYGDKKIETILPPAENCSNGSAELIIDETSLRR